MWSCQAFPFTSTWAEVKWKYSQPGKSDSCFMSQSKSPSTSAFPTSALELQERPKEWREILASFGNFTHCLQQPLKTSLCREVCPCFRWDLSVLCGETKHVLWTLAWEGWRAEECFQWVEAAGSRALFLSSFFPLIVTAADFSTLSLRVSVTAVQGAVQQYVLKCQIREVNGCFLLGSRL